MATTSLPAAPLIAKLPAHARLRQHGGAAARAARPRSSVGVATAVRRSPRVAGVRCAAVDGLRSDEVEAAAVARSVPARVAYELQLAGHRYLDVRTEGEFSAGHPEL
ncbi:unnamed protein product [Urochloa humidicola]